MNNDQATAATDPLTLAVALTAVWLGNPNTRASAYEVPLFLRAVHQSVTGLMRAGQGTPEPAPAPQAHRPAVSARKSLSNPDHIVSMIDGRPYRALKRHLVAHGLTPDQYRERYRLKPDYPIVAPGYSARRRDMARSIGLGRKRDDGVPGTVAAEAEPMVRGEGQGGTAAPSRRKLKLKIPA